MKKILSLALSLLMLMTFTGSAFAEAPVEDQVEKDPVTISIKPLHLSKHTKTDPITKAVTITDGGHLVYMISVTNNSDETIQDATVSIPVPMLSRLRLVSPASEPGQEVITWDIEEIKPGQQVINAIQLIAPEREGVPVLDANRHMTLDKSVWEFGATVEFDGQTVSTGAQTLNYIGLRLSIPR